MSSSITSPMSMLWCIMHITTCEVFTGEGGGGGAYLEGVGTFRPQPQNTVAGYKTGRV